MKMEKKVSVIAWVAFWCLTPHLTNAQHDSVKTVHLNEVVVTAAKFPKNLNETGKVVTVIDQEQLLRSSGKEVYQLLNEQAGLLVNGAGSNPGKDKSVYLRGANNDYTLILLDGIPLNDPSGFGGAFDLRLLPIDQIEYIEILTGSQSTLYGSDAIAGVINIITRKAPQQLFSGAGMISYGSYNTFNANASISGKTNLFGYHAIYARKQSGGISEARDASSTGTFDKDGFNQDALQLNLDITPHQKIFFQPFVRYTAYSGKYDAGAFQDDKQAFFDSELINYGMTGKYSFTKGALNVQYANNSTTRTYESSFGKYDFQGKFGHAEIFFHYDLGKTFQALAGLNYQSQKMGSGSTFFIDDSRNSVSPYISFFARNIKGFSAETGARYVSGLAGNNVLVYNINPSLLIRERIKLFANYSTGFKAPTLSQLYGQFGANEKLKPEESKNLEGGIQVLFPDNKITNLRATAFSRSIKDVIVYTQRYENFDQQNDYGVEVESKVKVNDKINVHVFYAFVEGRAKTRMGDRDTTYNNLFRRPKHSGGIDITYQATKHFFASVNLKIIGKRSDLFFNPDNFQQNLVWLREYAALNLYLEYNFGKDKFKVFADAKNLLDQKYEEVYGYNTMRFNMNAGISFKF